MRRLFYDLSLKCIRLALKDRKASAYFIRTGDIYLHDTFLFILQSECAEFKWDGFKRKSHNLCEIIFDLATYSIEHMTVLCIATGIKKGDISNL